MENHPIPAVDSTASSPVASLAQRFADRWQNPRFSALCLGLLSTPVAAMGLVWSSVPSNRFPETEEPLSLGVALVIALVAVTAGALVGGTLGGSVVRKQPVLGLGVALLVAWPVAIGTLPLLPAVLGWPYRAYLCADGCSPWITADKPVSGLTTYADMLGNAMYGPIEVAAVLALIAILLAGLRHRIIASAFTIAAFVAFNFWSIAVSSGAQPAILALIVGSAIWAAPYLTARAGAERPPPVT